jgi:hypothetical protein
VGNHDPPWIHNQIFEWSRVLPLKELVVRILDRGVPSLRIGSLFNLRKIYIEHLGSRVAPEFIDQLAILISRCPNLTHLEINCPHTSIEKLFRVTNANHTKPPLSIEHLNLMLVKVTPAGFELALRHLKALKHFGLHNKRGSIAGPHNTDIWAILRREKIILSTISTNWLEPEGLGLYLQAFHGLENLHVQPSYPHPAGPSSPLDLLQVVSLRHSISLVELEIEANYFHLWEWPFDEASRRVLSSFPNLKIFGVTFGSQFSYQESVAPESIVSALSFYMPSFSGSCCLRKPYSTSASQTFPNYNGL